MSDLTSLMQIAPSTAGYMVGQNQHQARGTEALRQQELAAIIAGKLQEAEHNQQMNPLRAQHLGLQNQGLEAGLSGITADSLSKQVTAEKAAATKTSDIENTLGENKEKGEKRNAESIKRRQQLFAGAAAEIETTPSPLRLGVLHRYLKEGGAPDDKIQLWMETAQAAGDKLPQLLNQYSASLGKQAALQSADYHKSMDQTRLQGANQMALEKERINAGKYNKNKAALSADQAIDMAKSARERHQKLIDAATIAKQNGDQEGYDRYIARAEAIRPQAEAEIKAQAPGGVNVGAVANLPTNAGPQIAPPGAAAQPKLPVSNLADVQKMYPGVPADKLREAYKKKFGVDLK